MVKPTSPARLRTLALQERAIRFSTRVNASYPSEHLAPPSEVVWGQLVRAADGVSNHLVAADNGGTDADFLNQMRSALRDAKQSRACLGKIRLGNLANAARVTDDGLEAEADALAAIYFTIIARMEGRLARAKAARKARR